MQANQNEQWGGHHMYSVFPGGPARGMSANPSPAMMYPTESSFAAEKFLAMSRTSSFPSLSALNQLSMSQQQQAQQDPLLFLQDESPALYNQHSLPMSQHPATAHGQGPVRADSSNRESDMPLPANMTPSGIQRSNNEMSQHQFPAQMGNDVASSLAEDFQNLKIDHRNQQRDHYNNEPDFRQQRNRNGPRICKFFLHNKCNRGPHCNFAHIIPTAGMYGPGMLNNNNNGFDHRPQKNQNHNQGPPQQYNQHPSRQNQYNNSPQGMNQYNNHGRQLNRNTNTNRDMNNGRQMYQDNRRQKNRRGMPKQQDMHPHGQDQFNFSPHRMEQFNRHEMHSPLPQFNTIEEVRARIYGLARTQNGCRQLQRILEKNHLSWKVMYEELQDHWNILVNDPFGHHLCLRLLDFITPQTREKILSQLKEELVAVSLSVHGTRVMQKLLELMETPTELKLVEEAMSKYVITLAKDVYGMHVILRCLHRIPAPCRQDPSNEKNPDPKIKAASNQFIFDEVTKNIVTVATHKHGCCVVQWCIDYATPTQRKKLVDIIVQNSLELSQDAFGNYVVQQIMDPTHPEVLQKLVTHLQGSVTKLAVQKFSSIVIEKCLEYTESEQQMQVIKELVNPHKLPRLLQDPYANYVIQKALSVTHQENFQEVVQIIRPHLVSLSNTPFGKRIKTQMIRRFPILSMSDVAKRDGPPQLPVQQNAQQHGQQHAQQHGYEGEPTEI